jgi:hypothetical protein
VNGIEETMRFLEIVWGEEECYVDLPSKVGGSWVPYNFLWPDSDLVRERVETALKNREDLYFSVARFKSRGRRYEDTLPTLWLWADLDMVDPEALEHKDLLPTVAWQSSVGRYQALWLLDKEVKATEVEKINQRLTYHIGADRGGWDLTQVLRVPGTRNYKYSELGQEVKLLWADPEISYGARAMWARLRDVKVNTVGEVPKRGLKAVRPREEIGARAKLLLRTKDDEVVMGERSDRLWELECLLAEAGRSEMEIFQLVEPTPWNKFKEDREGRGDDRLRKDIRRALLHVAQKTEVAQPAEGVEEEGEEEFEAPKPQFVDYANFISARIESPKWLVEDVWTSESHGLIAGEPKTLKSTMALAMGISVASGRPFLSKYPVHVQGPVLMIQEENDPWVVQDRMRKIANSYGLLGSVQELPGEEGDIGETLMIDFPPELPFKLLNNTGWDLTDEDSKGFLEETIRDVQPAMVILDPLYLMIGDRDTDRSQEVVPSLKWLMMLRFKYNCAIVVVHHYRKQQAGMSNGVRPGQRVMGSGTFHGWVESALYCEPMDMSEEEIGEGIVKLKIEREFRNVGPRPSLDLSLKMGEPGELEFEVEIEKYSHGGLLRKLVVDQPGITARKAGEITTWGTETILRLAREEVAIRVESAPKGSFKLYPNGD